MAASFEKYLFKEHRAVYVHGLSPVAAEEINLLDVFIKTSSEGYFSPRPVLKISGPMFDLGTADSQDLQNRMRQGLKNFHEQRGDELFKWVYSDHDIDESFASAKSFESSLLAAPLAEVSAHVSLANGNISCKVEGLSMSTACVVKKKLVDYVVGKQWNPDINNRDLKWPDSTGCLPVFGSGGRKLWIIDQILYASKLSFTSGSSASVDAKAATVVPGAPGAGISASRSAGPDTLDLVVSTNSKFPGKFMFAYRAVCFNFNFAGELVGDEDDVGPALPVHRGEEDGLYDDERAQIRGLFLEEPPEIYSDDDEEDDDESWDVQRLPIEV